MTRECDVCGDDTPTPDLVGVGDGRVCPECHSALFVDESTDTAGTESTVDRSPALEAFADAVEFFHEQLDRPIDDHQSGEQADRPDTGREYFERVREWNAETVDAKRLGWAPADGTALLDYLMAEGYDRNAILGIRSVLNTGRESRTVVDQEQEGSIQWRQRNSIPVGRC